MSDFGIQLTKYTRGLLTQIGQMQEACELEVEQSILDGSLITGSVGLPRDTLFLRESWKWKRRGGRSQFASDCAYAEVIEYGDRGYWKEEGTKRPEDLAHTHERTGQTGSVGDTVAGWPAIVAHYAAEFKMRGSGGQNLTGLGSAGDDDE